MLPLIKVPTSEQIRKEITSLLLDASQSLEDAFRVHDIDDNSLVLKVQNAVQQLLTLFKEFHLRMCDPNLIFNANEALTGFNILINFCNMFQSDCLFSRLCDVLNLPSWVSSCFQIFVLVPRRIS